MFILRRLWIQYFLLKKLEYIGKYLNFPFEMNDLKIVTEEEPGYLTHPRSYTIFWQGNEVACLYYSPPWQLICYHGKESWRRELNSLYQKNKQKRYEATKKNFS